MIKAFEIENFKVFKNRQHIPLKPITLIYGPNSAGKSSVIQAFTLLEKIIAGEYINNTFIQKNGHNINIGRCEEYLNNTKKPLTIGYSIENTKIERHSAPIENLKKKESKGLKIKPLIEGFNKKEFNKLLQPIKDSDLKNYKNILFDFSNIKLFYDYVSNEYDLNNSTFHIYKNDNKIIVGQDRNDVLNFDKISLEKIFHFESYKAIEGLTFEFNGKKILIPEFETLERLESHIYDENDHIIKDRIINFVTYVVDVLFEILEKEYKDEKSIYIHPLRERFVHKSIGNEFKIDIERTLGLGGKHHLNESDNIINFLNKYASLSKINEFIKNMFDLNLSLIRIRWEPTIISSSSLSKIDLRDFNRLEVKLFDHQRNRIIHSDQIGTGISQLLPILTAITANSKRILIEQPEIHLHPRLQAIIGDLLICGTRPMHDEFIDENFGPMYGMNDFIVETHSEHLLLRIMKRIRQTTHGGLPDDIPPITPDDVAVLYVNPTESEGSEVLELRLDKDGEFIDPWPDGFFEEGYKERFF